MNGFVPNDQHMHEVLILLFNMKKSATEAYQEIRATYGAQYITETTCRERYEQFAKGDFAFKETGRLKANKRLKTM
uniref:HTH_48 domain-containing protein n=1 Tax=Anopheles minimus TaxID=112268 RepID=A0A182WQ89_9DIPT